MQIAPMQRKPTTTTNPSILVKLGGPLANLHGLLIRRMANSKYEYVRQYEGHDSLLPGTFIVVRIDGRGFHRWAVIREVEGAS